MWGKGVSARLVRISYNLGLDLSVATGARGNCKGFETAISRLWGKGESARLVRMDLYSLTIWDWIYAALQVLCT